MSKKVEERIDWMDVEALAAVMCGLNPDVDEGSDIENAFYEKFGVDTDVFQGLLETLWPMLDFDVSPLTDTPFVGFSEKKQKAATWIMRKDVSRQFINSVIHWLGGDDIKPGDKGMARDITNKGKIEYKITITKV